MTESEKLRRVVRYKTVILWTLLLWLFVCVQAVRS